MAQLPHHARAQVDQDDHDQDNNKVPQFLDKSQVQIPEENQDQPALQVPFQEQDQDRAPQFPHQDEDRLPNEDQSAMPKKSMGRQKIDIAKMQNERNLKVTFSKRRQGLFKKASELVTLCDVELVIIVFSPGNKPFSFGHPSVDDILDRFLSRAAPPPPDTANNIVLAQQHDNVRVLNNQLTNMQALFEAERQKKLALDQARTASRTQRPWEAPIDELSRDELVALKAAMLNLQANMAKHIEMRTQQEQQNPSTFQAGASSFGGLGGGGGSGGGRGAASSSGGGDGNDVFPSFPPAGPSYFGEGGGGFPQYVDGSTSHGGGVDPAFSTGLNYFGGGALPSSTGRMIPQSSMGSSSLGGGLALPFPQGSSSFGRGSGHGGHALQIGPSSSGLGGGGALHIGPSPSGSGRGRGQPSGSGRGCGRGSNRGTGRGPQ